MYVCAVRPIRHIRSTRRQTATYRARKARQAQQQQQRTVNGAAQPAEAVRDTARRTAAAGSATCARRANVAPVWQARKMWLQNVPAVTAGGSQRAHATCVKVIYAAYRDARSEERFDCRPVPCCRAFATTLMSRLQPQAARLLPRAFISPPLRHSQLPAADFVCACAAIVPPYLPIFSVYMLRFTPPHADFSLSFFWYYAFCGCWPLALLPLPAFAAAGDSSQAYAFFDTKAATPRRQGRCHFFITPLAIFSLAFHGLIAQQIFARCAAPSVTSDMRARMMPPLRQVEDAAAITPCRWPPDSASPLIAAPLLSFLRQ